MIKIKRKSPPKIISDRSIISHSRSRDKSSSGDDKKSNSSLKKKLYKHEIFDKRHSPSNFKTLHRIRQQALQQEDVKWKSTEELSLKDRIIEIIEKEAEKNNKLRKNIESYDQLPELKTEEYIKNQKLSSFRQEQEIRTAKNISAQNLQSKEPQQIIVTNYNPNIENRDQEILRRKLESNVKFLTSQTSQLLSFTKFMLLQADIDQTKKKMSQISIYLRQMRINMRNHEYTKQINFTFPINKHNDQINVKMPEQVSPNQMVRYRIIEERLKIQNQTHKVQEQKLNNLTKYYLTLLKKYNPIIDQKDIYTESQSPKKRLNETSKNKLKKAKSCEQIVFKSKSNFQSFCTSNSGSSNKKSSSKHIFINIQTNKSLIQTRFFTLSQKKQALIDSISKLKSSNQSKIKRLTQEVQLLKKQLHYLNQNVERTQRKKNQITLEIQQLRKKKMQIADQNRQNSQKYLQSIENMTVQRKLNYLKEKYKRNLQDKGFANNLRQNKSVSPQNYLSNVSRNFLASYSPRYQK